MCTWSDMYNFFFVSGCTLTITVLKLCKIIGLASHVLLWHRNEAHYLSVFFTRNTVILPHDLHSFNLTSFEAKTVEIPHLLHNFEAKTVVLPRCLQSFKAKVVVSPHFLPFPHSLKSKLWYVFISCILVKPQVDITTRFAQSETWNCDVTTCFE